MTKPNTKFDLSVEDIDAIENALRGQLVNADAETAQNINGLLARLHHQKNWYRPRQKVYISG